MCDFNADPKSLFGRELEKFCEEFKHVGANTKLMNCDTFTYVSDAQSTTSWLDHCVVSKALENPINSVNVQYDAVWSDHLPMIINLNLQFLSAFV